MKKRVTAFRRRAVDVLATAGLTPAQERMFHLLSALVVAAMVAGWTMTVVEVFTTPREELQRIRQAIAAGESIPAPMAKGVTSALLDPVSSGTPFIDESVVRMFEPLRGESGELRVVFRSPGEVVAGGGRGLQARFVRRDGEPLVSPDFRAPADPGDYLVEVGAGNAWKRIEEVRLVTMVPFSRKENGRIGTYFIGNWPFERGGSPPSPAYAPPVAFIRVTRENRDLELSRHFRLGDFLTKDQPDVWPKYLLLDPRLVDKLELVILELQQMGVDVQNVHVMSGFRTPRYNHSGGNTEGRASLSRHMYGDAADIFIDNDRRTWMDDINNDGRIDIRDAELIAEAAERVERKYPHLIGGIGIYKACCGHGPFTHIDVRGSRARWRY